MHVQLPPLCACKCLSYKKFVFRETKKKKKERGSSRAHHRNNGRCGPWLLASPMPRPHVFLLANFFRHILGDAVWLGMVGIEWEPAENKYFSTGRNGGGGLIICYNRLV